MSRKKKSDSENLKTGVSLYQRFSGHKAEYVDKVPYRVDTVQVAIGHCLGIMYETVRDGKREKYLHRFKKGSRPVLAVSADGRQLYLLAGAYKFTECGIEDRKRKKG